MVGVTVTGVDVGATPINPNTPLVYVQMTAINDILTRSFLRPVRPIMAWVLMLCLLLGFIHLCEAIRGVRVVLAASLLWHGDRDRALKLLTSLANALPLEAELCMDYF